MSLDPAVAALRARQEADLSKRVRRILHPQSGFDRGRLTRAGIGKRQISSLERLSAVPPASLDDYRSFGDAIVRATSVKNRGGLWPSETLPIVYSARDLKRLGLLGARIFEAAGMKRGDVAIDLLSNVATRDRMQLQLGARRLGLNVIDDPTETRHAELLGATAIAGAYREVIAFLEGLNPVARNVIQTVFVVGECNNDRQTQQVETLATEQGAEVIHVWAPAEAFAAWGECRGGSDFHTWPRDEIVESLDTLSGLPNPEGVAGNLVLTWLGNKASTGFRLRTDALGSLSNSNRCNFCGRATPRVTRVNEAVSFGQALDIDPGVATWAAELHEGSGGDELVIFVAPAAGHSTLSVVDAIERRTGGARVNLVSESEVERLVGANNGERFGDRRAFSALDGPVVAGQPAEESAQE